MDRKLPPEYRDGREQTFFKHRAQREYMIRHAMKLGSIGARLWFCDMFSGPWKSRSENHEDTSVFTGLSALREARNAWRAKGKTFPLAAVFVENDPDAFQELTELCRDFEQEIEIHPLHGRFQDHVAEVDRLIGEDPAFIFVDPTGWKDAGMQHLAVLAHGSVRDVMIRVPSEVYRFRSREDEEIQRQLLNFLGLDPRELGAMLTPEQLIKLYCDQLKRRCGFPFAASMTVPYGDRDALACWLVIGGHHPQVLNVFRDVEKLVIGADARDVREELRAPEQQPFLFTPAEMMRFHHRYADARRRSLDAIPGELDALLGERGEIRMGRLWPRVLERHHVTRSDLVALLRGKPDRYHAVGMGPRERPFTHGHHVVRPGPAPPKRTK